MGVNKQNQASNSRYKFNPIHVDNRGLKLDCTLKTATQDLQVLLGMLVSASSPPLLLGIWSASKYWITLG